MKDGGHFDADPFQRWNQTNCQSLIGNDQNGVKKYIQGLTNTIRVGA